MEVTILKNGFNFFHVSLVVPCEKYLELLPRVTRCYSLYMKNPMM